jgi:hypothetical protein
MITGAFALFLMHANIDDAYAILEKDDRFEEPDGTEFGDGALEVEEASEGEDIGFDEEEDFVSDR